MKHNGVTMAGAFDTDNYKHNTLAQMALVDLESGDKVCFCVDINQIAILLFLKNQSERLIFKVFHIDFQCFFLGMD